MKEIYKEYCRTNYTVWEVSNYGNVRRNGIVMDFSGNKPYYNTSKFFVHRAVAELFIPNPDNKPCIDHIDGDKTNNNVLNLRWATYAENRINSNTRYKQDNASTGKHDSEETKLKKSKANKGKKKPPVTEEHRKHLSEALKRYYTKIKQNC